MANEADASLQCLRDVGENKVFPTTLTVILLAFQRQ